MTIEEIQGIIFMWLLAQIIMIPGLIITGSKTIAIISEIITLPLAIWVVYWVFH